MKRVLITFVLLLVEIAAVAGIIFLARRMDSTPPVIFLQNQAEVLYRDDITPEELLAGVKAMDSKDGDVSDTLQIETITPGSSEDIMKVVYTAEDKNHNVVRFERNVKMEEGQNGVWKAMVTSSVPDTRQADDAAAPQAESKEETQETKGKSSKKKKQKAAEEAPVPTEIPAAEQMETTRAEQEAKMEDLSAEAPRISLTDYYVEIPSGEPFDETSYIESIEDDVDSEEFLLARLITNGTIDVNVPGTYEVTYYVLDSSGKQSNMATLTVRVR